jgi:hypothetical protein
LFHVTAEGVDTYTPSQQARYANRTNRWEKTASQQRIATAGVACSVKSHSASIVSVASTLHSISSTNSHSCFLDVLVEWGYTWLWDNLKIEGDEDWILQSIQEGSIFAVTDGSYLKELYPDIYAQLRLCWNASKVEVELSAPLWSNPPRHVPTEESFLV